MKNFIKISAICFFISGISLMSIAKTSVATGAWSDPNNWVPVGVPTSTDDVIIGAGHVVTNIVASQCQSLTVNGTLNCGSPMVLKIYRSYTVSATGTEQGNSGQIYFWYGVPSSVITAVAPAQLTSRVIYIFYQNMTIAAGTTISKPLATVLWYAAVVTNFGTVTFATLTSYGGSGWINSANSSLTITVNGFLSTAGTTLTANASGNTVTYNISSSGTTIKDPTAGYYNLILSGGAGKNLGADITVLNNLTISNSAPFNSNGYNVTVGGNWVKNGSFTASSGKTVTFNGSAAQTISGAAITTFEGLTINNAAGVSISSGTYILNDVLTVTSGAFNTSSAISFTMVSTAAKTARIAQSAGSISGNFTIQRYITVRDTTWCDLSSPVQSTTFADWANGAEIAAISYDPVYPTQYTYSEPVDYFVGNISSGTTLTPGKGYEVFLSGNYSYGNFPNTTINTIGVPNQGDKSYGNPIVSYSGAGKGSNLVGNPFASPISWNTVLASSVGLNATIDMYDYASNNYKNFGAGTIIAPTQGFWVYANSAPTLNIPESAKVVDVGNTQIRSNIVDPYFTLTFACNDNGPIGYHVLKINASTDASDGWDITDHPFRKSPNKTAPSIYSVIEGKKSVINAFNSSNETYSIPLNTQVGISGNYKIEAKGFNFMSEYTSVKLEDKFLNKMIDLTKQNVYSFQINTGDNSNRFIVHFSKNKDNTTVGTSSNLISDFANQVEVLPSLQGNIINFNLGETTNTTITLVNILGQPIANAITLDANSQSVNVLLPEGYSGMYLVKIASDKGTVTKKFVKN